jgi:hypothetical protein
MLVLCFSTCCLTAMACHEHDTYTYTVTLRTPPRPNKAVCLTEYGRRVRVYSTIHRHVNLQVSCRLRAKPHISKHPRLFHVDSFFKIDNVPSNVSVGRSPHIVSKPWTSFACMRICSCSTNTHNVCPNRSGTPAIYITLFQMPSSADPYLL